ncbi:MAG: ABC transporter ATP-binding protein [Gemmatimonadota bacterium]
MSFVARAVSVTYSRGRVSALEAVSVTVQRGTLFAIIGPNGSGKSTLVRTLLGAIPPDSGEVSYEGRRIAEWARAELARNVGAVTQLEEMPFPVTVRELVAMGRYPHLGALRGEREADRIAIERAMKRCDVAALGARAMDTLSGGERQRARIARALAQTPNTLVLDEPTAALDIAHEMAVFELLRSLAHDEARTVVVATHHLNLAARYSDALLLLSEGRVAVTGRPSEVMRKDILESVYHWPVSVRQHAGPGFDAGAPQIAPLSRTSMESL